MRSSKEHPCSASPLSASRPGPGPGSPVHPLASEAAGSQPACRAPVRTQPLRKGPRLPACAWTLLGPPRARAPPAKATRVLLTGPAISSTPHVPPRSKPNLESGVEPATSRVEVMGQQQDFCTAAFTGALGEGVEKTCEKPQTALSPGRPAVTPSRRHPAPGRRHQEEPVPERAPWSPGAPQSSVRPVPVSALRGPRRCSCLSLPNCETAGAGAGRFRSTWAVSAAA